MIPFLLTLPFLSLVNSAGLLDINSYTDKQKDSGFAIQQLGQAALDNALKLLSSNQTATCNQSNVKIRREW
jgi:hypothetical protein